MEGGFDLITTHGKRLRLTKAEGDIFTTKILWRGRPNERRDETEGEDTIDMIKSAKPKRKLHNVCSHLTFSTNSFHKLLPALPTYYQVRRFVVKMLNYINFPPPHKTPHSTCLNPSLLTVLSVHRRTEELLALS